MKKHTGFQLVVFDCDGVMFDTTDANKAFYNQILHYFGKPGITEAQFAVAHMVTADDALAHLFDDEKTRQAAQAYRRRMDYRPFIDYMVIEPHLLPLLNKIRPPIQTAVATNRSDSIGTVLETFQLSSHLDYVACASDVNRPKPHPDMLLKVLNHFRVAPTQALYVGDSKVDQEAAGAAGMPFAAYANPSLGAQYHVDSLKLLERILMDH